MSGSRRSGCLELLALAAAAAAGLAGCGEASSLPLSPPTVDVEMYEYGFRHLAAIPVGRVVFNVRNVGKLNHELLLVVLPEDFPMTIQKQIRSDTRQAFATPAQVLDVSPESSGKFAIDLVPGRYAFLCFIPDSDGVKHANKGMSSEFRASS